MIYRELGQTGIKLSAVVFGAWPIGGFMWGGSDEKKAVESIRKGYDLGMTTIDTAPIYGTGLSEELVGKAIKDKRDDFQILTKFSMHWKEQGSQETYRSDIKMRNLFNSVYLKADKNSVIQECEDSLRRLGTDYIDYYQQHWPVDDTPIEETMEALDRLKDQGKIRAGGVCNYSLEQMKEALKTFPIEGNQLPYSMLKRDIEKDIVPFARENDNSILAYSPLQRGLLSGKFNPDTPLAEGDNRKDSPYFKTHNIQKVNHFLSKIRPIAEEHNVSLVQLVLSWTLHQPGITFVLAGARTPEHAEENAKASDIVLSKEQINTISKLLDTLELDMNK
jgi:aryl-alcohol dehydrogenase-like predicted oxidoreductase